MSSSYRVIVVGLGAMGASALYHLSQRGVQALGIEQFSIGHSQGSSGGDTRIIRRAYFEHPDYVPLLDRAYALWDKLGAETDVPVLHRTGLAYFGAPGSTVLEGTARAARQYGLDVEALPLDEARRRFPPFVVPDHFEALYEPDAGFVRSERAIQLFIQQALAAGADVRACEPVVRWQVDGDGVRVETVRETYRADKVIFAAGAWTGKILGDIGVDLRVCRQVLGWVQPRHPQAFGLGTFPSWIIDDPSRGIYYGFPLLPATFAATLGLKVARHVPGPPVHPDHLDRAPTRADERDYRPALRTYLPDADGPTLATRVCMYTMTPDEHFVVDLMPQQPRVVIGAGFSGHGFKFASAIGEALADLAVEEKTPLPVEFLGLNRFA